MEGRGPVARTRCGKAGSGLRAGTRLSQAPQRVRAIARQHRDKSRMRESRTSGSVRGVRRKPHLYSTEHMVVTENDVSRYYLDEQIGAADQMRHITGVDCGNGSAPSICTP